MLSIIKQGVQNTKLIRKFKCRFCYCKFKTDEYTYTPGLGSGMWMTIKCPECKKEIFMQYKKWF